MPKEGVQVVKLQTTDRSWGGGHSLMSHGVISPTDTSSASWGFSTNVSAMHFC